MIFTFLNKHDLYYLKSYGKRIYGIQKDVIYLYNAKCDIIDYFNNDKKIL